MVAPNTRTEALAHDRAAIADLATEFAWLVDRDGGIGVEELFTKEGVYVMGDLRLQGHEAIRGFYAARRDRGRTSRHVFSSLIIELTDERSARARSVLTLYAADGPPPHAVAPVLVADYDDELVRDERGGRWRFAVREVTPVFGIPTISRPEGNAS